LKCAEESLHPPVQNNHVLVARRDAVALAQLICDGRAQLRDAGGRSVACLVLCESARHGLFDVVGREGIGFAAFELINGRTTSAQLHNLVADFDYVGESDPVEARG
jgi:hypothetical protein